MKAARSFTVAMSITLLIITFLLALIALSPKVAASPIPLKNLAEANPTSPENMKIKMKRDGPRLPIHTPPPGPGSGGVYDKTAPGNR
ncbi:MAG: hypothetical protein J3R72DRAFT_453420 [Linnemannia gamsii]|nr:MAG: hypothetical protein J3R72DRAFT_453420 [Linnemannia gamsii]